MIITLFPFDNNFLNKNRNVVIEVVIEGSTLSPLLEYLRAPHPYKSAIRLRICKGRGYVYDMIPREARAVLLEMAGYSPVVAVTGARQSGKTTLARTTFPDRPYFNLEDPSVRSFASEDPIRFMKQCHDGAIIDEVQRVPELFSYMQVAVDEHTRPGRFVLTGSSQFLLNERISQSLAGRAALLHLLPLSYRELQAGHVAKPSLSEALFFGGYPPIYDRGAPPKRWYADYISTYVERDLRQLIRVQQLDLFQRFLSLCAAYTGKLINYAKLGADAGVSANTAKQWLGVLEASYVVFRLLPHHANFRKRLVKQPKLYFIDTGLASRLLRIEKAEDLHVHPLRGALFENWVVTELLKQRRNAGEDANLFFWRSHTGHEVDILIDKGLELVPVECKSGETIASDWFAALSRWSELAGPRAGAAHIVYGGDADVERRHAHVHGWRNVGDIAE